MSTQHAGLTIVFIGVAVVLVGLLVWSGALRWFGHLPGDIRIEGERTRVYFPLVSMLVASIVLSVVLNLVRRLFR